MTRVFADLSNNQQSFDARAYRQAGHVTVALKATEGLGFVDPTHAERAAQAHAAGLSVGHYHFARPDNHRDPAAEVAAFAGALGVHVESRDWYALDLEVGMHERGPVAINTYAERFRLGWREHFPHRPLLLYTYLAYLEEMSLRTVLRFHGLWVADYNSRRTLFAFGRRSIWARQFTDGQIGAQPHEARGVGRCDLSVLNGRSYRRLKRAG